MRTLAQMDLSSRAPWIFDNLPIATLDAEASRKAHCADISSMELDFCHSEHPKGQGRGEYPDLCPLLDHDGLGLAGWLADYQEMPNTVATVCLHHSWPPKCARSGLCVTSPEDCLSYRIRAIYCCRRIETFSRQLPWSLFRRLIQLSTNIT